MVRDGLEAAFLALVFSLIISHLDSLFYGKLLLIVIFHLFQTINGLSQIFIFFFAVRLVPRSWRSYISLRVFHFFDDRFDPLKVRFIDFSDLAFSRQPYF
jgi:hypothetical protein